MSERARVRECECESAREWESGRAGELDSGKAEGEWWRERSRGVEGGARARAEARHFLFFISPQIPIGQRTLSDPIVELSKQTTLYMTKCPIQTLSLFSSHYRSYNLLNHTSERVKRHFSLV